MKLIISLSFYSCGFPFKLPRGLGKRLQRIPTMHISQSELLLFLILIVKRIYSQLPIDDNKNDKDIQICTNTNCGVPPAKITLKMKFFIFKEHFAMWYTIIGVISFLRSRSNMLSNPRS